MMSNGIPEIHAHLCIVYKVQIRSQETLHNPANTLIRQMLSTDEAG